MLSYLVIDIKFKKVIRIVVIHKVNLTASGQVGFPMILPAVAKQAVSL